ncbi:hypothetical protein, secreted [gut metagenome]|uniref:DUF4421 domain-containing protein n=1 Tax=gut metagenome TaxID=749906 RepID=J9H7Y0_9ZZZZ
MLIRCFFLLLIWSCCSWNATAGQAALLCVADHVEGDSVMPSSPGAQQKGYKKKIKQKIKHSGNLFVRFVRSFNAMDTTYIEPNKYNYTAMLQNTNFRQDFRLRGSDENGHTQTIYLSPAPAFKVGPYFGWRWIFLGYTFDIGHPQRAGKSTEFNLSLYSSMLGVDWVFIRNTGDFKIRRIDGFGTTNVRNHIFSGFDTYTACLNAYYVFNHKRFSYPAAFAQSTVQRKSCGSWILGVRFDKQKMKFDHDLLPQEMLNPTDEGGILMVEPLKFHRLDYRHYSISGGYAYNWVFAKNCLFSISSVPSIGYRHAKGKRITGEDFWVNIKNLNFDFITRAGLVWNNSQWFGGVSFVNHLYDYRRDRISLTNSVSYLNIYFGLCFNRRKAYR